MISKVVFEIKNSIRSWSDQEISFSTKDIKNISIIIKDMRCEVTIDGNCEEDNLQYIILIWELLVWEDGYFYKPISYFFDNAEKTLDSSNNSGNISIILRKLDTKNISREQHFLEFQLLGRLMHWETQGMN